MNKEEKKKLTKEKNQYNEHLIPHTSILLQKAIQQLRLRLLRAG